MAAQSQQIVNGKQGFFLRALSALLTRRHYAEQAGLSHENERDIYRIAGYKKRLEFKDFELLYMREDLASVIVDCPAQASWRLRPEVFDDDDPQNQTGFEKDWESLTNRLRVYHYMERVDRVSGIGRYGVLFIGLKDGLEKNLEQPAGTVNGPGDVLYLQALSEGHAVITKYVTDKSDPRFNQPLEYQLDLGGGEIEGSVGNNVKVHASRIIHVAEGLLEDEVHGEERLRKVYNRVKDLQKLVSGGAEMFWINARQGLQANVDPAADFSLGSLDTADSAELGQLEDHLDDYFHGARRYIATRGVDLKSLGTDVADPSAIFDIEMSLIAAKTGIPKRKLMGAELAHLASTEDKDSWMEHIVERDEQFCEPSILRPLIDRLLEVGALSKPDNPKGYIVKWPNPLEASPEKKAGVLEKKMQALKAYMSAVNPVTGEDARVIMDPNEFREALELEPRTDAEIQGMLDGMVEVPLEEEEL